MDILIATSNPNKAKIIQYFLARPTKHVNIDLTEIQAIDVKAVIEHKAREAFLAIGKPVLVEDTGLALQAWNGLPGALIRWFLDTVGTHGICKMLETYDNLDATAETCLGYFDGTDFQSFSGAVQGQIARTPRGTDGFGWDAIFIPNGWDKTFAEMTPDEGTLVSMRKLALMKLHAYLDDNGL